MREIIFKAKTINNETVVGLLSESKGYTGTPEKGFYISNKAGCPWAFNVRPETICQYIGIDDINGKKIYEKDRLNWRVKYNISNFAEIPKKLDKDNEFTVVFKDGCFVHDYTETPISMMDVKLEIVEE